MASSIISEEAEYLGRNLSFEQARAEIRRPLRIPYGKGRKIGGYFICIASSQNKITLTVSSPEPEAQIAQV
jgi:hypothetical protein